MTKVEVLSMMLDEEMVQGNAEYKAFIEHEIELLTKKRKPSKKQLEKVAQDNEFKRVITEALSKGSCTVGELQKTCPQLKDLSSQKVTSLLTQMVRKDGVVRTKEKGKAIFSL